MVCFIRLFTWGMDMKKQTIAVFLLKRWLMGLLLIPLITMPAIDGVWADPGASEEKPYSTLLNSLKNGSGPVDFLVLRIAYTKTPEYNPYNEDADTASSMFMALNEKKYEEALSHAQKILAGNYVDIDAHYVSSKAYFNLGNQERDKFHWFVFRGLIKSIMESGDGLSPETARMVINVREEYVILSILGFKAGKQQLIHLNGHEFDKLSVVGKEKGDSKEIYFNVDIPYKWLKAKTGAK